MIALPAQLLQIDKWKAYKGTYPIEGKKEHRIIIIYPSNPLKYLVVTSQIDKCKIRNKYDINSLAQISPQEWEDLMVDSCVQCGKSYLHTISEQELRSDYVNGKLKILGTVPSIVQSKITEAIQSSRTYTQTEKDILNNNI